MWKISFSLFIILNSIIGSMLFWQWNIYSEKNDKPNHEKNEKAEQVLTVETMESHLKVTQEIQGLKSLDKIEIKVPTSISTWNCMKLDGSTCISNQDNNFILDLQEGKLKLSFEVPLPNRKQSFLIDEWFIQFPNVTVSNTWIKVIDDTRREGTWITGLPLKGYTELELIDYYVFEGNENITSLFWNSSPMMEKNVQESLSYYLLEGRNSQSATFPSIKEIPGFQNINIVMTDQYPETNGIGVMIVPPEIKPLDLERKITYQYFTGKSQELLEEERWMLDVLTSLWMNQNSRYSKGTNLIGVLKNELSPEELSQFLSEVAEESDITLNGLDEILGELKDKDTHFFTLNKHQSSPLVPLYFEDSRKVKIKNQVQNEIKVVYFHEERYFPFAETLSSLGFKVETKVDRGSFNLTKDHHHYQFYLNENIYIYNDEDYGLLENPLNVVDGRVYMDDAWLQAIFGIILTDKEEFIELSLP